MAITVRRLAQHKGLGLSLVAGREGADRVISWAHAIELADPTPYLSGGELVMTTGINIGSTDSEQFDYVARLSGAGTVALAVDTGTTFQQIPDGVVAAGDALGMPILRVPASTPFIAITRAVIDELTADQLRSVQRVVDQQEVLARATLRGGTPGVVGALSESLSATVVIIGTDGRTLAASGPDTDRVSELSAEAVRTMRAKTGRRSASRVLADGDGYCTVQTVRAAQAVRGYLAVRSGGPLTTSDRLLVAHALSLISIELEKPAKVVDAERRLRTTMTRALIAQPRSTDPGALRYFGFDPDAETVAVVLSDVGPMLAAERHAHDILSGGPAPYLMASVEDEIVVILPAEQAECGREVHRRLGAQLQRRLGGGLSLPARLDHLEIMLNQARVAARAQRDRFCEFSQLGTFGVILGTRSPGELQVLAQALNPLDDYDRDQAPAEATMVATLEAFLSHNGQIEIAAGALGIHRHTMRKRLHKISELIGRDLQSADARAEMWVAIKARELLAITSEKPGHQ
jgi:PucR family transcriptional regulator, purine catabolism regulatory protein